MRGGERFVEAIGPVSHDRFDCAIKHGEIDDRSLALVASDDEVDADQRAFREKRIESAYPAFESCGEILADPRSDPAVVTLARDVDQNRYKSVETVASRKDPNPRTLIELKNGERELIERGFVDLKQFIARIVFEHVDQRLAGMA